MAASKMPGMSEGEEQATLFNWARMQSYRLPELKWMHHIPNGGARSKATAGKLKCEGVKPGVADIFLPVPRAGKHGMYIELKRAKGGRLEESQKEFLNDMNAAGYHAVCCHGWQEASREIEKYLAGETRQLMNDE